MTFLFNVLLFSHDNMNGNFCCGSEVYDPHDKSMKCCSGHLHKDVGENAECCGNLLLNETSKICCSSSTHAILYDTKSNHHCCGYYYYNASLWNCCSEHLKPTPSHNSIHPGYRLKQLTDLIPKVCRETGDVLEQFIVVQPEKLITFLGGI